MAESFAFVFGEPPQDPATTSPTLAPFAAGSHSSWTGAQHANESQARSANIVALRQLWREPLTMQEIAGITQLPLSSVCSLKAEIATELEIVDYEVIVWGEGRKDTKRARWRMRR